MAGLIAMTVLMIIIGSALMWLEMAFQRPGGK